MMKLISTTKADDRCKRYWICVRHEKSSLPGPWLPIWAGGLPEGVTLDEVLGEVFGVWAMLNLEASLDKCLETLGIHPANKLPHPGQLEIIITRNRKKGKQAVGYVDMTWRPVISTPKE